MPSVNQNRNRKPPANTESTPPKPGEVFVFRRARTYTRYQLIHEMGISSNTISLWIANGLKPLNTGTDFAYYWGGDLLRLWKSVEPMKRPKPSRDPKKKGGPK